MTSSFWVLHLFSCWETALTAYGPTWCCIFTLFGCDARFPSRITVPTFSDRARTLRWMDGWIWCFMNLAGLQNRLSVFCCTSSALHLDRNLYSILHFKKHNTHWHVTTIPILSKSSSTYKHTQHWTFLWRGLFFLRLVGSLKENALWFRDGRTQQWNMFSEWQILNNSDSEREYYNTSPRTQCTVVLNI